MLPHKFCGACAPDPRALADFGQVWSFIVEREVEAPERFQAIQSYRATMAVLRQQRLFVHQLFDSGVVEDQERDELLL